MSQGHPSHGGRVPEKAAFELKMSRSAEKVTEAGWSVGSFGQQEEAWCAWGAERLLAGRTEARGLELSQRGWQGPYQAFLASRRVLISILRALEATEGL